MKDIIKNAPKGACFLSGWMTEIPVNCVFNKGVTGCGATTLAIKQPGHTILAMPFRGLVQNKVASNPELLGIHGDMDREAEIANYVKSHDTIKIATTYDSFPFVCDTLISLGYDPYKEMFLFVDEWHILFNSYKFRGQAARHLLDRAKLFSRKTFVSATPIPREYWLTELASLPEYRIEWPDAVYPNMNSYKVEDPLDYMARLCKSRIKNGGDDNFHIFINSVEGIAKIIRRANLSPSDCRIVCSRSESSLSKNKEKLPSGFEIQTTTDPVRLFNFYTSTCFEGQDIYDEFGRTFIVSEKSKDHTKMDVRTTLPQICGRIRDSRYKNEITQIYSESLYKEVTKEEFEKNIRMKVEKAEHDAKLLNELTQDGKEFLKSFINKAPYIGIVDGKIVVDRNMANLEIVNYGIVNGQYSSRCNMNAALLKAGFTVNTGIPDIEEDEELEELSTIERTPFKDIFEEYVELSKEMFNLNCFRKSRIEVEKPLVKEAYEKLGADKVREMNYHQSNIKRELIKLEHETLDTKIFLMLDGQLPKQVAIPRAEIKEKLERIYQELKVKKTAKATDLNRWYYIKPTSKRSKDGSVQSCLTIVSAKFKK